MIIFSNSDGIPHEFLYGNLRFLWIVTVTFHEKRFSFDYQPVYSRPLPSNKIRERDVSDIFFGERGEEGAAHRLFKYILQ